MDRGDLEWEEVKTKKMKIIDSCVDCLYRRQKEISNDEKYLSEIRSILDKRHPDDSSPYIGYLFNQVYERFYGKKESMKPIKDRYNELVLSMEDEISKQIDHSKDPLSMALTYARCGNYIDFGALDDVSEDKFLSLLETVRFSSEEKPVTDSFFDQCSRAQTFLLIADNCGEIVLDKLFLERLKKAYPGLEITVMVRGGEVSNDATIEDAKVAGIDRVANIIDNGYPIAGTVYKMLDKERRDILDHTDVILAKGQGNYESLNGQGRHIFYSFLCKCDLFINRFNVPQYTGMFVEENGKRIS